VAVVLMGPTASGKSAVALELCERFGLEIVSVDSAQVYRGMDIGTAKPDRATRARVPHHLLDLLDPTERYSAARFRDDALAAMHDIASRGRVPLLAGGTMLYFKALSGGLSELPAADEGTRQVIDAMAEQSGWPSLHGELSRVDPETARRLDPNDAQRIQRALEIFYLTGKPMSSLLAGGATTPPPFRLLEIALVPSDRAALHQRISARFETMLESGLLAELEGLRRDYDLRPEMPSMRCVGYRQAWQYLDGEIGLARLRETGIAATRQLAKRQLTWLRAMQPEGVFDCLAPDLAQAVSGWLAARLAPAA
jgi:tRNA dimethylallyltransferase